MSPLALCAPSVDSRLDAAAFALWAASKINSNLKRAMLGEYIIRRALGVPSAHHEEWDSYDIAYQGRRLEVKTSGFLTPPFAPTRRPFAPTFDIRKRPQAWDAASGGWAYAGAPRRHAEAYIFALHLAKTPQTWDPLRLEDWAFFAASTPMIDTLLGDQKTVSLSRLSLWRPRWSYEELKQGLDRLLREEFP